MSAGEAKPRHSWCLPTTGKGVVGKKRRLQGGSEGHSSLHCSFPDVVNLSSEEGEEEGHSSYSVKKR